MPDHVIFSYILNGLSEGQELRHDDVARLAAKDTLTWTHLDRAHPDTRPWLLSEMSYLDESAIDALLADETRPRATVIGNGILVVLRGVNLNEGANPEDMVSIRMWVDDKRIVTMRRRPVRAAEELAQKVAAGDGPKTSGAFLAMLADMLDARIETAMRRLDEATDDVEEHLVVSADNALRPQIADIRRRTIQLRRHIAPQREAVAAIKSAALPWIGDADRRNLAEAQDRLTRFVEDLDAIRDRAQVVKDELANVLADRLNRNTYILSVIAAIFLPLGFLTGLVGINLAGIPGAENPSAFYLFCGLLGVIVLVQIVIFRLMKWF